MIYQKIYRQTDSYCLCMRPSTTYFVKVWLSIALIKALKICSAPHYSESRWAVMKAFGEKHSPKLPVNVACTLTIKHDRIFPREKNQEGTTPRSAKASKWQPAQGLWHHDVSSPFPPASLPLSSWAPGQDHAIFFLLQSSAGVAVHQLEHPTSFSLQS